MDLLLLSPDEWTQYAENAHLICFDEKRPSEMNRIDFALLVVEGNVPLGYMTCREVDNETVYMQYGGAFPSLKGTIKTWNAYCKMMDYLKSRFVRATTLIENTNQVMMKFAMKMGLQIIGIRNFKTQIFLEHFIEWR
jgi:hypothetical protein